MWVENNQDPSAKKQIAIAVAIAGLSALAAKLVDWGVEELKGTLKKDKDK